MRRDAGDELVEYALVEVDRGDALGLGQALGVAGQAEGAVAARLRSRLTEVADERLHLAAVMRHELDDACDPRRLGLLAAVEPFGESVGEGGERRRFRPQRVALTRVGRLQLDETLLLEVAERGDDAVAFLAERSRRCLRVDRHPGAPFLAAREHAAQEFGAGRVESGGDLVEGAREWTYRVAGIERRALFEVAVELDVGEDRPQHERSHVVSRREVVLGDGELLTDLVREHLGEEAVDRLAGGRVAVCEVLEHRYVLGAREELADARLAVTAGAPDLLRVRLEALRQVEVVDVAHVRLVDSHAEGDRRDDDVRVRRGPPVLDGDAVVGVHARVVRPRRLAGGGEKRSDAFGRSLQRHVHDGRAGRAFAEPVDQHLVAFAREQASAAA